MYVLAPVWSSGKKTGWLWKFWATLKAPAGCLQDLAGIADKLIRVDFADQNTGEMSKIGSYILPPLPPKKLFTNNIQTILSAAINLGKYWKWDVGGMCLSVGAK